jgi:hypothetical protein
MCSVHSCTQNMHSVEWLVLLAVFLEIGFEENYQITPKITALIIYSWSQYYQMCTKNIVSYNLYFGLL